MYKGLIKELKDFPGGVDQYIDFAFLANNFGFNVYRVFRGKDYSPNEARYEVWVEIPDCSKIREGKGDSLGAAVKDAVQSIMSCEEFLYLLNKSLH